MSQSKNHLPLLNLILNILKTAAFIVSLHITVILFMTYLTLNSFFQLFLQFLPSMFIFLPQKKLKTFLMNILKRPWTFTRWDELILWLLLSETYFTLSLHYRIADNYLTAMSRRTYFDSLCLNLDDIVNRWRICIYHFSSWVSSEIL